MKIDNKITLKERIYLIEILRGLYITSYHFTINIFFHILNLVGYKKRKGAVTIQYPEEKRKISDRWRGRHRIIKKEDGTTKCVACMLCETICPTKCIKIIPKEIPDPDIEKYPASYELNILRCCFCGLCVLVCPKDAIRMDTQILDIADYKREKLIYNLDYLKA